MTKRIIPYGQEWEKRVNMLLRSIHPVTACVHCGNPHLNGYSCTFCGSVDPEGTKEEHEEFWEWAYNESRKNK
jgi:hypothetical protein